MKYIGLPKEYILENYALYDVNKIELHVKAALSISSLDKIYKDGSGFFTSCFNRAEEKEIAMDILRWLIDTEKVFEEYGEEIDDKKVINRFFMCLHEAGFFG